MIFTSRTNAIDRRMLSKTNAFDVDRLNKKFKIAQWLVAYDALAPENYHLVIRPSGKTKTGHRKLLTTDLNGAGEYSPRKAQEAQHHV